MYSIGQVLYVVLTKKNQVYPMQVVEVITKKTLKGEDVSYVLQAGSDTSSTVMLDKIDGEVFETAEKARTVLTKRATSQIDRLIDAAVKKSKEWYEKERGGSLSSPQTIEDLPDFDTQESRDAHATVTLPDGSVAKLKMPSNI
jgi:hypothetical protein